MNSDLYYIYKLINGDYMDEYTYDDSKYGEQTYTLHHINTAFVSGAICGFLACIIGLIHLGVID